MKNFILILFLFVPFVVFGQSSLPLITTSATTDGILKQGSSYSAQSLTQVFLGNVNNGTGECGRGFAKFDLSSITFTDQDMLQSAFLVFTCDGSSNKNSATPAVYLGKPPIEDLITQGFSNLVGHYAQLEVTSTNLLGSGYYLYPNTTTEIPINLQEVKNRRYANPPQTLPVSYVAADEISHNGILVKNVQLLVKYWDPPTAPTNLIYKFKSNQSDVTTTISWTAPTTGPAKEYTVYYRKQLSNCTWDDWKNTSIINAPTVSVAISTEAVTKYEYKVRATNPANYAESLSDTFTTPDLASISGPSEVCYSASTFSLNNGPLGTIYWTITGSFSFDPSSLVTSTTAVQPTLYRTIGSPVSGLLAARTGSASGPIIVSKNITACVTSITGPNEIAPGGASQYNLVNAPAAQTIYWTVSNPGIFSVVSSNCPTTVTRTGTGNATLSARVGSTSGTEIATKYINAPVAPVISGTPTLICYKSAAPYYSFSATNFISGYEWGTSSNLSIKSGQGTYSVSVNAASSGSSGDGWVSVKTDSGVELARYNLWVGAPSISSISGPTSVSPGSYNSYQAICNSLSVPNPTSFYWTLNETGVGYTYQTTSSVYAGFSFYNSGYYQVICQASNVCGTGGNTAIGVYAGRGIASKYNVYPNPVSDILYIEIPPSESNGSKSTSQPFDIRLYDGLGNLLRQSSTKGGTTQFNVSNLPDGLYYLHIYDGVSSTPEIQQIEVAR